MSLLRKIDIGNLGQGSVSRPSQEKLLEGNPEFTAWPTREEPVQIGVWAATPGLHVMDRDEVTWEQFYLLEGEIEVTEEGQPPRRFRTGDIVIVEPKFRGTWRTVAPVKKLYVSVQL